jgi:hypothetical protein
MSTSRNGSVLSEIVDDKPIPLKTLRYFRRLLLNRFHEVMLQAFIDQEKTTGLNQKQLAGRISRDPAQVTRWLNTAGNLTLETISDFLLGMGVDLDHLSVTPIFSLVNRAERLAPTPKTNPKPYGSYHSNTGELMARLRPPQERDDSQKPVGILDRLQDNSPGVLGS